MSDDNYDFREARERADMALADLRGPIDQLLAQLAQRDAALKAADWLILCLQDCLKHEIAGSKGTAYSPWENRDKAIAAYRKARGQDETAKG
jgi:hypothetical protein